MPRYRLRGIDVEFPYDAYDCQLVYMERVIDALQKGCNALLESPTGTGKTLCLLCASLAWRASLKPGVDNVALRLSSQFEPTSSLDFSEQKLPKILYASRTHSQLHQVIRELKATAYRPKMIVLGSREQMCIHGDVRSLRGRVQNHACRSMVKERGCHHHSRVAEFIKTHPEVGEEPVDIEDLVSIGKAQGPCPYYLSRELHSSADILFLPYNYLIDKENRRSLTGINWANTVLIFDEAHNLENLCADAASFDLPASHLTACIAEAKECVDLAVSHRGKDNAADTSIDPDNFAVLKALLLELEKRINEIPIDSSELGFTRPGAYIYEFLSAMKINWQTVTVLIDTIEQATSLLEDEAMTGPAGQARSSGTTYRLMSLKDALSLIFRSMETSHASSYKVHIREVRNKDGATGVHKGTGGKVSRTLSWWCFNPGIAMEEFAKMGVRSVILTSGTLAPLDSFAYELKLPFDVRLENPHVIDNSQIWVGVVPSGPSGRPLNSSYKTRDSPEYKQELGNAIVNFARIVPDGLLVFFPSYHLLNTCVDAWQSVSPGTVQTSTTIWERICKFKQPVIEPRESALFNQANESFVTKLCDSSSTGAIFFAVCRGKVSEGLDFADRAGRAVVVTGIPYAMKTDPKVRLKREYLDEAIRLNLSNNKGIRGEEWYVQQAARAVNQAVGRVIRHRNDYGAIILCDERFAQGNSQSQMSLWLRPHIKCYSKFGDAAFTLTRFFRDKAGVDVPVLQKPIKGVPTEKAPQSLCSVGIQGSVANPMDIFRSRLKTRRQEEGSFGLLNLKRSTPMGQLSGNIGPGLPVLSRPCQPLSEMLAASRSQAKNQSLSTLSIVQANCAVGSTTGFIQEGSSFQDKHNFSAYTANNAGGIISLMSQVRSTSVMTSVSPINSKQVQSSACSSVGKSSCHVHSSNSLERRHLEPLEKPWSLSKRVKGDNGIMPSTAESGKASEDSERGSKLTEGGSNEEPIRLPLSVGREVAKATPETSTNKGMDGSLYGSDMGKGIHENLHDSAQVQQVCQSHVHTSGIDQVQQVYQPKIPKRMQKTSSSANSHKTRNAAEFLQEVKAHLSIVEYKRFLECMRGLKNEIMSMATLLKTVSNLFSAPERLFLFRRFGDFIPSQHRQLYDDCLAARCSELECPSEFQAYGVG